jgi:hypothetical protein
MSVISPNQFLSQLLENRGLNSVTAEPLFTYQLKQNEYQALKQIVVTFLPKTNISKQKHLVWAACYVLWCSEWYRREYQAKDGWSWSAIWQELGFELSASDISATVPLGMASYWCRPIRFYTERRNFLGSVFIEGGLPFQLISTKDNKFGDLIRKVLANYYQVDLLGIKLSDLIHRYVYSLPKVFAEDESIELISSVVRNLMGLADKIDTNSQNELPSEQLDKLIPNWRNQFPIPLDNDTGKGLLDNWLRGASAATSSIKKFQKKLACKHYFDFKLAKFFSEVSMPKKLYFDFDKSKVSSSRLDLGLTEGIVRRANFGSVYAQFEPERTVITTRKKGVRLPRNNVHERLYVDVTETGISVEKLEIPASSISLGQVPIGFVLEEDKHCFIGQASFTTKHPAIFILMPAEHKLEIINGECTRVDELSIEGQAFTWYEASGDIRFIYDESRYRICTNSTTNTSGMLRLVGKELPWQSKPSSVYLGLPIVKAVDDSTDSIYGLTTFIDNKPVNTVEEYERYGAYTLTVKNKDNDTLIRRKIAVLPNDLDISFSCEDHNAVITVSSERPISTNLVAETCKVASEKNVSSRRFLIEPKGLPPSKVTLFVQANLECEPIELTLPYPASGIYGYNAEGKVLDRELTINQLLGSEISLYSDREYAEKFTLEFSLLPDKSYSPSYISYVAVAAKPQVVSLYSFKERIIELLSLSDSLDAQVQISISNSSQIKKYIIRRFASNIKIDRMNDLISFETDLQGRTERIPLAMRMAEPERKPIELKSRMLGSIELGQFEIANEMKKNGPWLIIPNQDVDVDFRPTFYPTGNDEDFSNCDILSIQTAVKAYHPVNAPRIIAEFLNEMAANIEHPSWGYFRNLWDDFGYLPLSTFEAWKVLVKLPSALTLALFKFEMNDVFIRRVDAEFPMLWELIPIDHWLNAKQQFTKWLLRLGASENLIDEQIGKMFDRFSNSVPSFPVQVIEFLKGHPLEKPFSQQQEKMIINNLWLQDLIREHSESDWPIGLKYEIEKAANELEIDGLINFPHFRQSAVALYPAVAAAIAIGKLEFAGVFRADSNSTYALKQLRDFDPVWFSSIYSYFISYFSHQEY